MKYIFPVLFLLIVSTNLSAQTFVDHYRSGVASYEEGNFNDFLESFKKADSLRPNHRVILYNLAAGYALTEKPEKAIEVLKYRSGFYAVNDFSDDEDFNSLKDKGLLTKLVAEIEKKNSVIQTSDTAFELSIEGLHAEGITFNEQDNRFYITDIRNGWIYSISRDGEEPKLEFDLKEYGYWSAMGIKFDPRNPDRIWVTTSAVPNFVAYADSLKGRAAVLLFDQESKNLLNAFSIEGNHVFGDLILTKRGSVYFTDSVSPAIYKIDSGEREITEVLKHEDWWSLQGLAFSKNEKDIYVSDYITGIQKINLQTNSVTPISTKNELLRGSDGIYLYQNNIILLQNGTSPKRLGSISLNEDGLGITSTIKFLDNAIPGLDEPTLGVIIGSELYYIFNSPWAHYDRDSNPISEEWKPLKIHKLSLEDL